MKEIVQDGTPILREIATIVPPELFGTPELARIIADMITALDPEVEGVALAAPQIGIPYRIFLVRTDRTITPAPIAEKEDTQAIIPAQNDIYINPEIIRTSKKRTPMDEGCLSVRNVYGTTDRHTRVTLRAQREDGSKFERGSGGLLAQIFEHEIDHLNGILFIDHATRLVRIEHESKK